MGKTGETILRKLSRDPGSSDYPNEKWALRQKDVNVFIKDLEATFPGIRSMVEGKKVLDIGCAHGMETLALSMLGAGEVHGIDIIIDAEKNRALQKQYPDCRMAFSVMAAEKTLFPDNEFDAVVTCYAFEHFKAPYLVLKEARRILKNNGLIFLTSSVWSSPWGAHMYFFTKVPWVQFLFSEKTIMNVRRDYRNDGAERFSDVKGGLNKVGLRDFHKMVKDLNLKIEYLKLVQEKRLAMLGNISYINEFFTHLFLAVLRK